MIKHICKEDHKQIEHWFKDLPESQAGGWRHKCAGCAYDMGIQHGINIVRNEIDFLLDEWIEKIKTQYPGI